MLICTKSLCKKIDSTVSRNENKYRNARKTPRERQIQGIKHSVSLRVSARSHGLQIDQKAAFRANKLTLNKYKITIQHWKILVCTINVVSN